MQVHRFRWLQNEIFRDAQQSSTWRIVVRPGKITALRNRYPIGSLEVPAVIEVFFDPETTFVHQRVVIRTQQHQVIETRLATVRPVLDVMAMQVAAVLAARKRTAVTIPCAQCSLDGSWDGAGLAPDA